MVQHNLKASVLLQSKTFHLVLNEILSSRHIGSSNFTNIEELNEALSAENKPDLIFLDKESAVKAGLTPFEYIAKIRNQFNGPILLISTEQDINEIENYVTSGITDVFSPSEFEHVESFVSNFVAYQTTMASVTDAKVLLVEDSRSMTNLVKGLFEQHGIEVLFVPTGREALTVLHFEQVDLVVTDYMLEGDMTGLALIRNIRRTTQWYSLPILAITGYNDQQRNTELMRNGVSDVMHKPFDIEMFLIKCQSLIQNKRTFQMLMEKQNMLTELTQKDSLTGLYNRQFLTQKTEAALAEAEIGQGNIFLLHLDCDNFKQINHELGHAKTDELLVEVSNLLSDKLDKNSILARIEGDEFMICLPNSSFENAIQIADMLREEVAQKRICDTQLTVSVGVSGNSQHNDFSQICKDTDQAIIEAKKLGGNQVAIGDLIKSAF